MSPSSPSPLPTPRQLLTSILDAISGIPVPEQPARGQAATPRMDSLQGGDEAQPTTATATATATNPLRLIDPAHRPLFATLHVLFPALLLPALDLLDRGLVTRLLGEGDGDVDGHGHGVEAPPPPAAVYLVRSAQKPTRRPYSGVGGGGAAAAAAAAADAASTGAQGTYVVQTAAWNCTCAAFAFSAFPPAAGSSLLAPGRTATTDAGGKGVGEGKGKGRGGDGEDGGAPGLRTAAAERRGPGWQFGGMDLGLDGDEAGEAVPPCCKHLLACVLAERWGAALGRYVVQRAVGREEMAGIFADI